MVRKKKPTKRQPKFQPTMSDVISHLEKLPTLKGHSICVTRSNPQVSRVISKLQDVEAVACYLALTLIRFDPPVLIFPDPWMVS
jgi:hypothetical protein